MVKGLVPQSVDTALTQFPMAALYTRVRTKGGNRGITAKSRTQDKTEGLMSLTQTPVGQHSPTDDLWCLSARGLWMVAVLLAPIPSAKASVKRAF